MKKFLYIKEVKKHFHLERKYCVKFEPNYSKKYLFFLSNNRFIEVLNCVQFTVIGLLF